MFIVFFFPRAVFSPAPTLFSIPCNKFSLWHDLRIQIIKNLEREYSYMNIFFILDTYIQKTKKLYIDSRARRNLGSINTELQDVQRIMVANIEEVLQRGETLSGTGIHKPDVFNFFQAVDPVL